MKDRVDRPDVTGPHFYASIPDIALVGTGAVGDPAAGVIVLQNQQLSNPNTKAGKGLLPRP